MMSAMIVSKINIQKNKTYSNTLYNLLPVVLLSCEIFSNFPEKSFTSMTNTLTINILNIKAFIQ